MAECRLFFLASTGSPPPQGQSVTKIKGVGLSTSRHRWTSTVKKVANLGVHFATVIVSPNLKVSTLPLTDLTQKGQFPGHNQIHLLYISTTAASHFSSTPVLYIPDARRKRHRTYVLCSDLRTSLCTRLSMIKRSTPPPSTVRSEAHTM